MTDVILERRHPDDLPDTRRMAVDDEALEVAESIIDDVRDRGREAVREHAERLGDIEAGAPLFVAPTDLDAATDEIPADDLDVLRRSADRIVEFAEAQRDSLTETDVPIPGGRAGHSVAPVERAGCYAPGGRYPLPSSVLMTVATARAAGVDDVWLASPNPPPITRAAAAVAGADGLLRCGGAQAIAAMTYGAGDLAPCDVVVGPGSRWVTAAKQIVSGTVQIDMLAGPSELVVFADDTADPATVAADLLAQAEHDDAALPVLITPASGLLNRVERALDDQLIDLPTAETARGALTNGFAVEVDDIDEGIAICDRLAPEHLEILVENTDDIRSRLDHYGALFVGEGTAEVFGDYGAGPNHTLPTGGTARSIGGLSVLTFLRVRTWMEMDGGAGAADLARDTAAFARLESLEAHARSAEQRIDED